MSLKSKIEWTENSWNPITGCSKFSEGCKYCYAEKLANRLQAMGQSKYANGFNVTIHEKSFKEPLSWKKPSTIFVCSMSDLFHENVDFVTITRIFDVMRHADWHIFQIVTKRSSRLAEYACNIIWPKNVWAGVTVESFRHINRIEHLKNVPAAVRFISFEPLLTAIPHLDLTGIEWVITGGESGVNPRPIKEEWVKSIRNNCMEYDVPFFFKQWGGKNKKLAGRLLEGREWNGYPKLSVASIG